MFAVTERLLLRPGWPEDAPALAAAIGEEAVGSRLARLPWPYALRDAEEFLALPADPLRPAALIFRRRDARLVGGIGLMGTDAAELGYWIARDHWGRGFATEAGAAIAALADHTLRLPSLIAHHAVDNPASGKVLVKLGFVPVGGGRIYSAARGTEIEVRGYRRPAHGRQRDGEALAA